MNLIKKLSLLFIILIITHTSVFTQNTVCFTIETNPNSGQAFSGLTKYINVLDCFQVHAESSVPDSKVLHAAAIAAELLDNNEDGIVDDQLLKAELTSNGALIPIFSQEGSSAENSFFNYYNGNGAAAVLYKNEMDPSLPGHWGDDATVEEILHVINHVGHTNIYSTAFSLSPNSSLMTAAMDVARGGQFTSIPNPYPTSAWYHYNDATCDYQCMVIEYMYWSIVSLMGILDDPSTCNGIANEWELCSPTLFQATDTLMYNLITDPQYLLPQLAPDGNYCPNNTNINEASLNDIYLYPNPSNGIIQINSKNKINSIEVFNTLGMLIESNNPNSISYSLDLSYLPDGIYVIIIDKVNSKKISIN